MSHYYLIGIRMNDRIANATSFQEALTQNGCRIKTRLGMHEADDTSCTNDGIVIVQPIGEKEEVEQLVENLNKLDGVTAKLLDLN